MWQFKVMITQLERNHHEVGLATAPDPKHSNHKVRVIVGCNPMWYQLLCAKYPSSRIRRLQHPDTRIKRQDIIKILSGKRKSKYLKDLIDIANNLEEYDGD